MNTLNKMGTVRKLTIHDMPKYNGVAERLNHTLLEKVRAMLHASGLPKNLWGKAVMHAVYLKNCTSAHTRGQNPIRNAYWQETKYCKPS
jgi:hypothetical protein